MHMIREEVTHKVEKNTWQKQANTIWHSATQMRSCLFSESEGERGGEGGKEDVHPVKVGVEMGKGKELCRKKEKACVRRKALVRLLRVQSGGMKKGGDRKHDRMLTHGW